MILVHCNDGRTLKLDPNNPQDRVALDPSYNQRSIRRVSVLNGKGSRIDLPPLRNRGTRVWIEIVSKNGESRGERVCFRNGSSVLEATLFYSDDRVVIDIS